MLRLVSFRLVPHHQRNVSLAAPSSPYSRNLVHRRSPQPQACKFRKLGGISKRKEARRRAYSAQFVCIKQEQQRGRRTKKKSGAKVGKQQMTTHRGYPHLNPPLLSGNNRESRARHRFRPSDLSSTSSRPLTSPPLEARKNKYRSPRVPFFYS